MKRNKIKNFWGVIDEVMNKAEIIVSVLDARYPKASRNMDLESMIKEKEKSFSM